MRHTTTVLLLAAVLTLAGCSSSDGGGGKPTPTPTLSATSSAPAAPSGADQVAACTDAIVAGDSQDGPECAGLSADDLFKAVQGANARGRDALQSAIASASAADH
jgi:hypothetical protein